jgi:NAD(P)-dependent dehydrogenase (short-subunit alcohol dehydrogenase family)
VKTGGLATLKGKGVLITGAGRGIGKRLALGFAHVGAHVGLLARSQAELELAKLEIEHAGGSALRIRADVRNYQQMCAAMERMRSYFGRLDVLVCAAAVQGPIGPLAELKPKLWAETVETNLIGVMHSMRAALPHMVEHRSGKIIVLTGGGSIRPRPFFSAFAASKTAVVRLVETVAEEVRAENVQVNAMAPGATYTHMTDQVIKAGERAGQKEIEAAERVRVSGGTSPEKQINLALFLASERSNHISGKILHVHDDWKRLEKENMHPELYTLRRIHGR